MALMLRQACQSILNDADLDAFHADIDERTKYLNLYTPCGKHFAAVHGVRFGTCRPTKDEIPYAVELLEQWITRNQTVIQQYLDAFEIVQHLKPTIQSNELPHGWRWEALGEGERIRNPRTNLMEYRQRTNAYRVNNREQSFTFYKDGTITNWQSYKGSEEHEETQFLAAHRNGTKLGLPPTVFKAAEARCKDQIAYEDAERLMMDIHAELNSCET